LPDLGPHAVFIIWAYLGIGLATLGLIAYVALSARRAGERLKALEAQGIRRRSAGAPEA
jgi:heme exporter protein D